MAARAREISTITAKGQTTVPKAVRQALGVESGDRIAFTVGASGVTVHRVDDADSDPAIDSFLSFLATDIARRPESVTMLSPALSQRIHELTAGMIVDPDAVIDGDVDL